MLEKPDIDVCSSSSYHHLLHSDGTIGAQSNIVNQWSTRMDPFATRAHSDQNKWVPNDHVRCNRLPENLRFQTGNIPGQLAAQRTIKENAEKHV